MDRQEIMKILHRARFDINDSLEVLADRLAEGEKQDKPTCEKCDNTGSKGLDKNGISILCDCKKPSERMMVCPNKTCQFGCFHTGVHEYGDKCKSECSHHGIKCIPVESVKEDEGEIEAKGFKLASIYGDKLLMFDYDNDQFDLYQASEISDFAGFAYWQPQINEYHIDAEPVLYRMKSGELAHYHHNGLEVVRPSHVAFRKVNGREGK